MYIEETRRRKFVEADQFFIVGDYNVTFYVDPYLSNGKEWYGVEIIRFDGQKEINRNWLYIQKLYDQTYPLAWKKLHREDLLRKLINYENNSRIVIL